MRSVHATDDAGELSGCRPGPFVARGGGAGKEKGRTGREEEARDLYICMHELTFGRRGEKWCYFWMHDCIMSG